MIKLLKILTCFFTVCLAFQNAHAARNMSINVLNGNVFQQQADLAFNSPFEGGLAFKRYYNSQSVVNSTTGFGWSHNFDITLTPAFSGSSMLIKIMGISGKGYYFEDYNQDGIFDSYFSKHSYIIQDAGLNYIWTKTDGTIFTFDQTGQLLSIADKKGNVQSFSYTGGLLQTVTDQASGRTLTFNYNAAGKIDHITGPMTPAVPDGIWVSYAYDSDGNLTHIIYADEENGSAASGYELRYEDTNDIHNLTSIRDFENTILSSWIYNIDDKAVQNTNTQGSSIIVDYTDPDAVEVTDAYGIITVYTIEKPARQRKITRISQSNGCVSCSSGLKQTDFDTTTGNPVRKEYFNGRIDLFQNYDANDNPQVIIIAQGEPEEKTILKTYHPVLSAPLTITQKSLMADAANLREKITVYDYDDPNASGNTLVPNENPTTLIYRIIEKGFTLDEGTTAAYEHISAFTYNSKGQVTEINGPLAGTDDVILFDYHPVTGDLITITYPETGPVTLEYDAAGNPTCMLDANTVQTCFTYDGKNRIWSSTVNSKATIYTYGVSGQVQDQTDRSNRTTTYGYNIKGLIEKIINPNGEYLYFGYDDKSNTTEKYIYSSQQVRTFFQRYDFGDPLNNPTLSAGKPYQSIRRNQNNTADINTEYEYQNGNLTRVITPDGLWTSYEYDLLNRVTAINQSTAGPEILRTEYEYDANNNLTLVRDAKSQETTYRYDDLNNLVQTVSSDTGTTQYTYDAASNLVSKNQNTTVANYIYDNLGRLTRIEYPDDGSQNVFLSYDQGNYGNGRLTSVIDPSGTCAYTYNIYGYLMSEVKTLSGITYTTSYTYDDTGLLTSITYPSGRQVIYQLGATGQTERVSTVQTGSQILADNITWHPFGPLKSLTYPNGKVYDNGVDLNYMTQTLSVTSAMDLTYQRSALGNVDQILDNLIPAKDQSFDYDDLYRLTNAMNIIGNSTFSYDAVGNREIKSFNAASETYAYKPGNNLLDTVAGQTFKTFLYDINGNITDINTRQYTYNIDNRLARATDSTTVLGEYAYNYKGQRVRKTVNAATIFHYDVQGNLIAETDDAGNTLKEYIYLQNKPIAMMTATAYSPADVDQDGDVDGEDLAAGTVDITTMAWEFGRQYDTGPNTYYYHTDHLGTPVIMTDDAGQIVWQADYTPFGTASITINTIENNLRFPGQYYDAETGLHYNYHRYYDPDTGRYLTPDPIGLAGGINPFVYVLNNPVNFIDPWGLDTYRQNRVLGIIDSSGIATREPFTHTFLYTTNPDGSLKHTYSWGNVYDENNKGLWRKDRPEDVNAAKQAIKNPNVRGEKVGDSSLDNYIDDVFNEWRDNPQHPSRHQWRLFFNCKNEATRLMNEAKKRKEHDDKCE